MQDFASQFAGFLWSVLCHSLWSIPLVGIIFGMKMESLSAEQGDRRMRQTIFASFFVPFLIALTFAVFETKSNFRENAVERTSQPTSSIERETPAFERPITNTVDPTQSKMPSLLISLRTAIRNAAPWAIFFWSAGMMVLSGRLFLGGIFSRFRIGTCLGDPELQSTVDSLAKRLRLRQSPAVRISKSVNQPMVAGILRPVVILPESWPIEADPDQVEAVLAHELAHVRRGDLRNQLIERSAAILWFFHPSMHRLIRNATMLREIAADRMAVEATGNPLALARALESFAQKVCARDSKPAFGLPLVASRMSSHLVTRVISILGAEDSRISKPERRLRWAIGASLLILAGIAVFLVQSEPFAADSKFRPALPIGGSANVTVGAIDPETAKIVYEVRLVNVDAEFAGESLRTASKLPPGQVLPDQFVIGEELTRTLSSHPSASCMLFPRVTASDGASVACRWEAPNQPKIATIELNGRPVPENIRNQKVWTELRFVGRSGADGLEMRSDVTDFNDRLKIEKKTVPASPSPAIYAVSVTEERKSNGTTKLKPGESLCMRLGESMEPYRKEPRFLYETVLGEKGTRVSQFVRLAIVTARTAEKEAN